MMASSLSGSSAERSKGTCDLARGHRTKLLQHGYSGHDSRQFFGFFMRAREIGKVWQIASRGRSREVADFLDKMVR
jgi:hypothetical protein